MENWNCWSILHTSHTSQRFNQIARLHTFHPYDAGAKATHLNRHQRTISHSSVSWCKLRQLWSLFLPTLETVTTNATHVKRTGCKRPIHILPAYFSLSAERTYILTNGENVHDISDNFIHQIGINTISSTTIRGTWRRGTAKIFERFKFPFDIRPVLKWQSLSCQSSRLCDGLL